MNRTWIFVICAATACWGPPTDEQRCEGGEGLACMHVGEAYAAGVLKKKDLQTALSFFHKGCDMLEAESCLKVAEARLNGHGGVKDEPAARKAMSKACDLGSVNGCRDFAQALLATGNPSGAKAAWARGCKLGDDQACNKLDNVENP